jgi:hypothetical protein
MDGFFLLTLASVELDGSWWWSCSVVEPLMLIWEVQSCWSSWISSHGGGVFKGIVDVWHSCHIHVTNLTNTSQEIEYLVLGNCKSASPGRNKVNFSIEPLVSTKGKILVNALLSFVARKVWRCPSEYLLHLVQLRFRSIWVQRPLVEFEGGEIK